MFWGVTLESGKRYSQKVAESYHLSMATLETLPVDFKPQSKEVAVMIEHGEAEYQLCVLEYGRIMQVSLDLIFDYGEVVTFFLNGEGTVHLTGYSLADADDETRSRRKPGVAALNAEEDDDDDEDDEDWTPSKVAENSESESEESDEDEEDEEDESDEESETDQVLAEKSETNEDEDSNDTKRKRKNMGILKNSKIKKRKISESAPTQNGTSKGNKVKIEKQRTSNHFGGEDSNNSISGNDDGEDTAEEEDDEEEEEEEEEENDDSVEYSSEEEKEEISSVGRTPMPNKRVSKSSLGESPDLTSQQKGKLKTSDISSSNKGTIPVTPQNARKLEGNVQVEDLRTGSGPPAKHGKFVFLHYVGKLQNGKIFEACEAPKKPFAFRLGKGEVIRGLEIGVQGMKTGGKRKITIPPNMGYGKESNDVIPPNSTLLFTVELKSVR